MAQLKNSKISGNLTVSNTCLTSSYKITGNSTAGSYTGSGNTLSGIVVGLKGNAETSYRTGNVNLTYTNIGASASSHTHTRAITTEITDFPTKVVNRIKGNAESTYRTNQNVNLTPANIGASAATHSHSQYALNAPRVIEIWQNTSIGNFSAQLLYGTVTALQSIFAKTVTIDFACTTDLMIGSVTFGYTGTSGSILYYGKTPGENSNFGMGITSGNYQYGRVDTTGRSDNVFNYNKSTGYWCIYIGTGYRSGTSGVGYCIPYRIFVTY